MQPGRIKISLIPYLYTRSLPHGNSSRSLAHLLYMQWSSFLLHWRSKSIEIRGLDSFQAFKNFTPSEQVRGWSIRKRWTWLLFLRLWKYHRQSLFPHNKNCFGKIFYKLSLCLIFSMKISSKESHFNFKTISTLKGVYLVLPILQLSWWIWMSKIKPLAGSVPVIIMQRFRKDLISWIHALLQPH